MTGKRRLSTSENMLVSIQEKIKWADAMSEIDKKHRKDVEEKVEEVKKSIFKVGWFIFIPFFFTTFFFLNTNEKMCDKKCLHLISLLY